MIPPTAILSILTAVLNWNALDPAQRNPSTFTLTTGSHGSIVKIFTPKPDAHLSGLLMRTTALERRRNLRINGKHKEVVLGFNLDRGIYTRWRFIGSTGTDSLTFGPQGHIISKRNGGTVDFGIDKARDTFRFTNRIDVKRCSKKHGFRCHPLNHLQRVVIKNFGKEDIIDLQGKVYRYNDVKNGLLPGVPADRLRIELMK